MVGARIAITVKTTRRPRVMSRERLSGTKISIPMERGAPIQHMVPYGFQRASHLIGRLITGHWAFVGPWGWTWVDDAPWGFAPFHYGRWAYVGGGWGWIPGPVAVVGVGGVAVVGGGWGVRPVYAPALVGFVGGGGFSASIEIGGGVAGVAWVPLGPRDVWVPGYHTSAVYMTNVNVTSTTIVNRTQITNVYNTTIINNNTTTVTKITYSNQAAPGAVTAVPEGVSR